MGDIALKGKREGSLTEGIGTGAGRQKRIKIKSTIKIKSEIKIQGVNDSGIPGLLKATSAQMPKGIPSR